MRLRVHRAPGRLGVTAGRRLRGPDILGPQPAMLLDCLAACVRVPEGPGQAVRLGLIGEVESSAN